MVHKHWISSGKGWKIVLKSQLPFEYFKIEQQNDNIFLEIYERFTMWRIIEVEHLQMVNIFCVCSRKGIKTFLEKSKQQIISLTANIESNQRLYAFKTITSSIKICFGRK